jgi:hypothetical protein
MHFTTKASLMMISEQELNPIRDLIPVVGGFILPTRMTVDWKIDNSDGQYLVICGRESFVAGIGTDVSKEIPMILRILRGAGTDMDTIEALESAMRDYTFSTQ